MLRYHTKTSCFVSMDFMKWVFLFLFVLAGIRESKACLEVERSALLEFKASVYSDCSDVDHLLPSWKDDPTSDCCDWERVTCDPATGHVVELSLHNIRKIPILEQSYHVEPNSSCFFNISMFQDLNELSLLNLSNNAILGWTHNKGFENSPKLSKLKRLDLSSNFIPRNMLSFIGKFLSLEFLDLSVNFFYGPFPVEEIYGLSNLTELLLSRNDINGSFSIQNRTVLRKLQVLDLSDNKLRSFSVDFGALTSLKVLSVADNELNETTFSALCGFMILEELDLFYNDFTVVPQCLQNLTSLELLDLSYNRINGQLPTSWISQLTSLKYFDIRGNNFQGLFLFKMFCNHSQLEYVAMGEPYFEHNRMKLKVETEDIDWIPKFQLRLLILSECNLNMINHRVPNFLLYQRNLRHVDLSHNNLEGRVPDWLLANNSRMQVLILANNSFTGDLNMVLHPMKDLRWIDVSDNQMQGMLPENVGIILPSLEMLNLSSNAFRGNIPTSIGLLRNLEILDLSHNRFKGQIPDTIFNCTRLFILKLSNNEFCGKFFSPQYNWSDLYILELNDNNFTGSMSNVKVNSHDLYYFSINNNFMFGRVPTWITNMSSLMAISLRHNFLKGEFPCEVFGHDYLEYIDLSQNFLSGPIPSCSGTNYLEQIHLESNNFSGLIPETLLNSSYLSVLNLRDNMLSGNIPDMIGEVSDLKVLLLGKNQLSGFIPKTLCLLEKLSLMDLSHNVLSGSIPHCLGNVGFGGLNYSRTVSSMWLFSGPVEVTTLLFTSLLEKNDVFDFAVVNKQIVFIQVEFLVKNQYYTYKGHILDIMSGLDLSCNNLVGEIPQELGNLIQMRAINISHNHLIGSIPTTFANLTQIESLDLSHNNLTGQIPFQLTQLTFMEVFSVAYNNLSGDIPYGKTQFGTFDGSSYEGNPLLCGQPLMRNCSGSNEPDSLPKPNDNDGGHWFDIDLVVFFSSFAASFFIFFLGVIVSLYVNPYWRGRVFYYGEKVVLSYYYFVSDNLFK